MKVLNSTPVLTDFSTFRMSAILLVIGSFLLAIALVLTIAFLWIYLGHYNDIEVKFKRAKYSGRRYFYKGFLKLDFQIIFLIDKIEFDEDYDEAPNRYRQVLSDYPNAITCAVYADYIDLQREGVYRVGVLVDDDDNKPTEGYTEDKLPEQDVSIK